MKYTNRYFSFALAFYFIINSYLPNTWVSNVVDQKQNNIELLSKANNESVKKDTAVNDPDFAFQWAVTSTDSNKAWGLINQKRTIKVAVVDTGVDYNHPDLKNRVLTKDGYNFINNNNNVMDDNWHGTHVAGIVAGEMNNYQGITGIVGPLDVKIIPVKVLDKNGQGDSPIIAKGIKYAVDKGADIINISIGFKVKDSYIEEAIDYANKKGVLVISAAGNDNSNCDLYSPAGDNGVVTVSAVDSAYEKANFSNYGSSVMVAAPGVDIISTIPGNVYAYRNGTSMAAPVVSGIAAMIKAENPNLTTSEVKKVLIDSATDIMDKGKDVNSGYGFVNAYKAIQMVKNSEDNSIFVNLMNKLSV